MNNSVKKNHSTSQVNKPTPPKYTHPSKYTHPQPTNHHPQPITPVHAEQRILHRPSNTTANIFHPPKSPHMQVIHSKEHRDGKSQSRKRARDSYKNDSESSVLSSDNEAAEKKKMALQYPPKKRVFY